MLHFMPASDEIKGAIDTLYLDRKGLVGNPGYDAASKAWDLIRDRPDDKITIWAFAVLAERADRVAWGTFRALVAAWLLETTNASFAFPNV
jgi:hypothetical protein